MFCIGSPSIARCCLLLLFLTLLLIGYAAAYARYYDFGGDVAWGHRFVLLPVQLLCLFAVPLLMQHHTRRCSYLYLLR